LGDRKEERREEGEWEKKGGAMCLKTAVQLLVRRIMLYALS
jgi:hypothetical protein